ncbi:FAD-binding oxidoreductase [Streptomyces sp. NPDC017941]|uniref:FAD-binding oxidoreductase n=1 Tax=Streptomyces sp. NPDC017941 TaxID=3365018 RepID=UPI0037A74BF7
MNHHKPPAAARTVHPTDPRYGELVSGMNQRWTARPDHVTLVSTAQQTREAVQEAVRAGKRVSVRSGGHCYENFVSNADVKVIIDLRDMNRVYWDPAHRAFAVEAGATLADVYEELYLGHGVVLPAGFCYSVGMGGHITGGGFGLLSRQLGLTVDHLYAVEVVTVDAHGRARLVTATRERHDPRRELWWAHTGAGGGNFGIVTRFWFRSPRARTGAPGEALPKPPAEVLLSSVALPWSEITEEDFTRLVHNHGTWYEDNSAPDSPYTALAGYLIMNHRQNGTIALITQSDATVPGAAALHADYLAALTDGVKAAPRPLPAPRRLPWLRATRMLGTSVTMLTDTTLRGDHKSACMRRGFTDDQVATLYKHLTTTDYTNRNAQAVLHPYGGRIAAVDNAATASSHRETVFKLLLQTFWSDPAQDAANLAWTRGIYGDLFAATGGVPVPDRRTDGCYVNYPDTDIGDPAFNTSAVPWSTLYYKDNYPRLQRVKAAWDPRDIFRHAQSVRLPG